MFYVYPDDDQLIRLKHAALLNAHILSCVDGYYVIINLIHNGKPNLKINQYILLNSLQSS
jgi:hypothetical protein